jgi:hypothetical protein
MSEQNIKEDAAKWKKLVEWIRETKDEDETDIWEFLEEHLGVTSTGDIIKINGCCDKNGIVDNNSKIDSK